VEPHNGAEEAHPGVVEGLYTVKKVFSWDVTYQTLPGITKLFPANGSLLSDIQSGDGKAANLFLQCRLKWCRLAYTVDEDLELKNKEFSFSPTTVVLCKHLI
jgi:hypothetical protein